MAVVTQTHHVTFERNRRDGWFRAVCNNPVCGFFRVGPPEKEAAIRAEAATHDLDWEPAEPVVAERADA